MGLKPINWNKYFGEWSDIKQWKDFLNTRYMYSVLKYLSQEYKSKVIYPKRSDIFKAFKLCNPDNLKVVILGREPYLDGRGTGLAFANEGLGRLSPLLEEIRKAVENDLYEGFNVNFDPTLESWAKQGVLLLNTSLTVQAGSIYSHKSVWDKFTKFVISYIAVNKPGTIFLLWGAEANQWKMVDGFGLHSTCYVKSYLNPQLSIDRGVDWKCRHFSEANLLIENNNGKEFCINW